MRAAHGLVMVLILSMGALVSVLLSNAGPHGMEDPARPDRGELAPFERAVPLVPLVRVPEEAGRVVDVAVSGDALAFLTRSHWYLHTGDTLRGAFGDPTPGSPDWISRPVSVAVGEDVVYVLDAGRFAVSVWDKGGARLGEIHLRTGEELSVQPTQVLLAPGGNLVVLSLAVYGDGTGRWEARSYPPEVENSETLLLLEGRARSFIFDRPYLASHGGRLLGAMALGQAFFHLRPGSGLMEPLFQRPDPPLWYVPLRQQRRYAGILGRMGGAAAGLSQLPEFWPSVRGLTVRPDGSFILVVTAGEDHQHLELLAPEGRPLRRFNLEGFLDPVFVHGGRAFLVREDLNETVIYEFVMDLE
jgi:hypothetical protein